MKNYLLPADICLPNFEKVDGTKWSVIACDQYTSQPKYWEEVKKLTKNSPTTLDLILPEAFLNKEDEFVTFDKPARDVFNQIRGLNSNPGGYFIMDGQNVKVYSSKVADYKHDKEVGLIIKVNKDSFDVSCANNTVISITEIKIPSKNKMFVRDFLNGQGKNILTINKKLNQ